MTDTARRPGGRTAAVRRAVLRATEDALIDDGFAAIDLAAVARRADVGKTTVYRRWGSPQALVADLLGEMARDSIDATRTGRLADDLLANARLVVATLTNPRQGPLFGALIAAATHDQPCALALAEFYRSRVDEWSVCIDDAITRREIAATTDAREPIRYLSAPLYYRFLTTVEPLTDLDARRSAAATTAAIHAGVFERGHPPVGTADAQADR